LVDALGNPLGFFLTGGEAHDLVGADHLLPTMAADTLIADKAFDADERVLEPLAAAGKTAVIPPRANRSSLRDYDRPLYGERHLIENFFARIKQFRAIATRYEKTARNFLAAVQLVASVVWLGRNDRASMASQQRVLAVCKHCCWVSDNRHAASAICSSWTWKPSLVSWLTRRLALASMERRSK